MIREETSTDSLDSSTDISVEEASCPVDRQQSLQAKGRLFVQTYGCQMNEYDSQKMVSLLKSDYIAAQSIEDADLVLINTCSVREKGEQKLFSLLGRLKEMKRQKPELIVGVGGCVAQQEGKKIVERSRGVDFVVGTHNLSLIPSLVKNAKHSKDSDIPFQPQIAVDYREEWEDLPLEFEPLPTEIQTILSPNRSPVRALVSIQRGCNKRCSFCVVPTTRGEELSRAPDEVLREIRLKARAGAREVLLLGQTVNSYGRDLTPRFPFSQLIREIAEIEGIERIRFTSPHPQEVRDDFIELFADVPKLAKQIHMPVQSGNDRILKAMNRNYRIERYREIARKVREASSEIALSTDIIVGFPTETEEEFQDTLNLVEEIRYHTAFYFNYSRRPNTVAAERYTKDQELPREVLENRFSRLHSLQMKITEEINRSEVGKIREVLVEGLGPRAASGGDLGGDLADLRGRTSQNVIVEFVGSKKLVGSLVPVEITGATPHVIRGRIQS